MSDEFRVGDTVEIIYRPPVPDDDEAIYNIGRRARVMFILDQRHIAVEFFPGQGALQGVWNCDYHCDPDLGRYYPSTALRKVGSKNNTWPPKESKKRYQQMKVQTL